MFDHQDSPNMGTIAASFALCLRLAAMEEPMIIVQGWVRVEADGLHLFREHARTLAKAARRAPGALVYAFGEDLNDPGLFHLVAHWADEHAVAAHLLSDEIAAFMPALAELPNVRLRIARYDGARETLLMER
jgi:quinol monooxygenase YgiN